MGALIFFWDSNEIDMRAHHTPVGSWKLGADRYLQKTTKSIPPQKYQTDPKKMIDSSYKRKNKDRQDQENVL